MTRTKKAKPRFFGSVKTEWLRNEGPDRLMKLLEDFSFLDSQGKMWTAPEGSIVDGASIPKFFTWIIGDPLVGDYRNASVIHDAYCKTQTRSYKETHEVFCEMLKELGLVSWKRNLMCFAVKSFGPRWSIPQ